MRFLTLVILLAGIVACKNQSSSNAGTTDPAAKADSAAQGAPKVVTTQDSPFVFNDTILVSLSPKDFAAVLKVKKNMPILDLRPESEFKKGHIWRSTNMDASQKDFMKNLSGLGRTQEYAVYCTDGSKSFQVAEEMKRLGFQRIYHLQKGVMFWGETGVPLQLK